MRYKDTKRFVKRLAAYIAKMERKEDEFDEGSELLLSLSDNAGQHLLVELSAMLVVMKAAEKLQSALDELDKVKTLSDWDANDKSLSRALKAFETAMETYKKL